jgi:NADH dehydrogenase
VSAPRAPHVVILGGGFAGLHAALGLGRARVRITLCDRHNHHLFQPLLYQVATAGLSAIEVAAPIRRIVHRNQNTHVVMAECRRIDTQNKRVELEGAVLDYDYLVVATGASHSYFGHDEWEKVAPGLKTIEDALEIRRRILTALECAERQTDPAARRAALTFVVVGAGPTGVELAGALAELSRRTIVGEFRSFSTADTRVVLLDASDRVLQTMPEDLSAKAEQQLRDLGVEVLTNAKVVGVDEHGVALADRRIDTRTVLWAAGVAASPLNKTIGAPLDRAGRVVVGPDLTVPGHREVFVCGDAAAVTSEGKPVPGLAPAAIQQGKFVAQCIGADLAGRARPVFRYRDKGFLATIGRAAAVGRVGKLHVSGFIAWFLWLFVHIFFLIGFRNRFVVLVDWAWSYLTYQRNARVIV